MSDQNDAVEKTLSMTAESVGRDILQALVQEIKLLAKPWAKLSEEKQNDVIDRLRKRVDDNVKMAVHLISAEGRTTVAGVLDQITIKEGVKAVIKFSSQAINLHELYECSSKDVLVIVSNAAQHLGGLNDVQGESDQRAMNLGNEYDPNGDGKGMDDDNTIDGTGLVAIEDKPLDADLEKSWDDGYKAAEEGHDQSTCPIMKGALCIEWVKGWKTYQKDNETEWWTKFGDDDSTEDKPVQSVSGVLPNEHGVYVTDADEAIEFIDKKNKVTVHLLELENGEWLWAIDYQIGTEGGGGPLTRTDAEPSRDEALSKAHSYLIVKNFGSKLTGKAQQEYLKFLDKFSDPENQQAA